MAKISSARLDMQGGRMDNVQLKRYGEYLTETASSGVLTFPAKMSEKVWVAVDIGTAGYGVVRTAGSQLWMWGENTFGQLAQITNVARISSPVQVASDKTWAAMAAGGSHGIAITTAGALWTWGVGTGGQMGQITSATSTSSPVQVASDKTWASVAGGSSHTAAITTGGALWAWGVGTTGQLGQITAAVSASSPVQVASDKTWASVSAGQFLTAAITTGGALWAWGQGTSGQLGQISNASSRSSPVQVASDKTWSSVAAGSGVHLAAITTTGALWAWGLGTTGQLGDNTAVSKSSPVQIASDKTWASVATGISYTLAITTAGTLWAWGVNASGQLGEKNSLISRSSPVQIASDKTWASVRVGTSLSAGLTTSGELYSWGTNSAGFLGNPAVPVTAGAVLIDLNLSNVWRVVLNNASNQLVFANAPTGSSYSFTLLLEQDTTGSRLVGWPGNIVWSGTLPLLTTTPRRIDAFHFTTPDGGATWFGFEGLRSLTSIGLSAAKLWGWGNNAAGQLGLLNDVSSPHPLPAGTMFTLPVSSVMASNSHTAVVTTSGQLWTWGLGTSGQLGQITTATSRSSPVQVASNKTWATVAAKGGGAQTAAITTAGALWMWGAGTSGALGQITGVANTSSPVQVASDKSWSTVVNGVNLTLGVTTAGTLWAWGTGGNGALGQITSVANRSSPVQVASDKTWASVTALVYAAAITTSGALWTWGIGTAGQLGQITSAASTSSPVQVASDKTWSTVAIGGSHTAAITTAGALWTWGQGTGGQLGQITSAANRSSPVQVASDKTWTSVSCGISSTVALTDSGQLWAWGINTQGQLGIGLNLDTSSPVQVGGTGVTWSKIATSYSHVIAIST